MKAPVYTVVVGQVLVCAAKDVRRLQRELIAVASCPENVPHMFLAQWAHL